MTYLDDAYISPRYCKDIGCTITGLTAMQDKLEHILRQENNVLDANDSFFSYLRHFAAVDNNMFTDATHSQLFTHKITQFAETLFLIGNHHIFEMDRTKNLVIRKLNELQRDLGQCKERAKRIKEAHKKCSANMTKKYNTNQMREAHDLKLALMEEMKLCESLKQAEMLNTFRVSIRSRMAMHNSALALLDLSLKNLDSDRVDANVFEKMRALSFQLESNTQVDFAEDNSEQANILDFDEQQQQQQESTAEAIDVQLQKQKHHTATTGGGVVEEVYNKLKRSTSKNPLRRFKSKTKQHEKEGKEEEQQNNETAVDSAPAAASNIGAGIVGGAGLIVPLLNNQQQKQRLTRKPPRVKEKTKNRTTSISSSTMLLSDNNSGPPSTPPPPPPPPPLPPSLLTNHTLSISIKSSKSSNSWSSNSGGNDKFDDAAENHNDASAAAPVQQQQQSQGRTIVRRKSSQKSAAGPLLTLSELTKRKASLRPTAFFSNSNNNNGDGEDGKTNDNKGNENYSGNSII